MPKNAGKRRFAMRETTWNKRPCKPVGTRGGPRLLLGLFAAGFVIISNNFFGIFRRINYNGQFPEIGFLTSTSGSWIQTSNLCSPKSNFQKLDFELQPTTSGSWTWEDGSGNRTSGSRKMEIVNKRMRRWLAAPIFFPRENMSKNAEKR